MLHDDHDPSPPDATSGRLCDCLDDYESLDPESAAGLGL
ncbi:hypothetical protein P873_08740 [Arenimonas composti TR7-09 = DSM 18010]|uniref:Uncharacterized protein n=1 Tax=Arenimonas composti TR7-09 = DSM 18010 TaxID=1121013 RepID=A0A091C001_9GAMM|nr:hypothetical protein P873_08740 [Arenimonas composti TR7-09 = DSM 18010]